MSNLIKEISKQLGVSTSTISRAINGQDLKRAGARAQAERIRKLAEELGYTPNSLARSLKTNHRKIIGLILPTIVNQEYSVLATQIQETLATYGYRLLLCVTREDPEVEAAHLRVLLEERVAGIIVVTNNSISTSTLKIAYSNTSLPPIVELLRKSSNPSFDAILIDDIDAGFKSTQHLLELGHRMIAIICGQMNVSANRLLGYYQAFEQAEVPVEQQLVCRINFTRHDAKTTTVNLLNHKNRPSALIATSSELAVGALQGLQQCNVTIPSDLSFIGFGNPDWFALMTPPLTSIELPIEAMAKEACQQLLTHINKIATNDEIASTPEDKAPVILRYSARLVVRASTRALL